jgi:hypothetical protein
MRSEGDSHERFIDQRTLLNGTINMPSEHIKGVRAAEPH